MKKAVTQCKARGIPLSVFPKDEVSASATQLILRLFWKAVLSLVILYVNLIFKYLLIFENLDYEVLK